MGFCPRLFQKRAAIIAMTAEALDGSREISIANGMDDFLTKPIRIEDLLSALQKWAPVKEIVLA